MPSFHDMEPKTPEGQAVNPKVWADGYGIWHASVPITTPAKQAAAARALILDELQQREGTRQNPLPTARDLNLHVTRERITNHGTAIYKEV